MNFGQAIQSGFKKYATFSGRAVRSEYWYWSLFIVLASITTTVLDVVFLNVDINNPKSFYPINTVFIIATLIPGIAVSARRLHDINKSGWWMLIALTIIGFIPLLYWACLKGTEGENRYGKAEI